MGAVGSDEHGDAEVFSALYARLCRFAAVVHTPGMEADDLVQEALARTLASRRLADLEWPEAYLRRAILRLASNDHRRARRHRSRIVSVGSGDEAMVDAYPSDLVELLRLSPSVRAAVYLHVVERLSYEQVAVALGCRPAAARKAGSRGLEKLRAVVDPAREDGT